MEQCTLLVSSSQQSQANSVIQASWNCLGFVYLCDLHACSFWREHPRQFCHCWVLEWPFQKLILKNFDGDIGDTQANKQLGSLIIADKHMWSMCLQWCGTAGITWKSMARLRQEIKHTTHAKREEILFSRHLVIKYGETIIYDLSKVWQSESSTTYLSNRTTWTIFFLVFMETLPFSDIWTKFLP